MAPNYLKVEQALRAKRGQQRTEPTKKVLHQLKQKLAELGS